MIYRVFLVKDGSLLMEVKFYNKKVSENFLKGFKKHKRTFRVEEVK